MRNVAKARTLFFWVRCPLLVKFRKELNCIVPRGQGARSRELIMLPRRGVVPNVVRLVCAKAQLQVSKPRKDIDGEPGKLEAPAVGEHVRLNVLARGGDHVEDC